MIPKIHRPSVLIHLKERSQIQKPQASSCVRNSDRWINYANQLTLSLKTGWCLKVMLASASHLKMILTLLKVGNHDKNYYGGDEGWQKRSSKWRSKMSYEPFFPTFVTLRQG
jgi:hypothetical protein